MPCKLGLVSLLLFAACEPETGITTQIPDEEVGTEVELDTEIEIPEVARFYFLEFPSAPAVSHDGQVLITDHETGGDVYIWTEDEGLEWVATTGAYFNTVHDISADGTKIIGSTGNYMIEEDTQASIWTRGSGWEKLGALPDTLDCPMQSGGYGLSDDGTVATGLAFSGCTGTAFFWTEDEGLVGQELLGNGGNRASAISGDGTMSVGFAQGNSNRTPAMWFADGTGQVLDMRFGGEFNAVNYDGSLAVGQIGSKAFRWTPDDGHELLGTLGGPGESSSMATAICGPDDAYILGRDTLSGGQPFIWDELNGIRSLMPWLEDRGVVFPDNARLDLIQDCNPSMTHIVGAGSIAAQTGVFIIVLPEDEIGPPTPPPE